jgi:hypothetical protein
MIWSACLKAAWDGVMLSILGEDAITTTKKFLFDYIKMANGLLEQRTALRQRRDDLAEDLRREKWRFRRLARRLGKCREAHRRTMAAKQEHIDYLEDRIRVADRDWLDTK